MSLRLFTARSMEPASILAWSPDSSSTFEPFEKNSGAPHSATSTCANSWQSTLWYDWHIEASESELAEVPLKTKNTSQSVSNTSRIRSVALCVHESFP